MTSVSIIIPTLNEQSYLPLLLQSIIDQGFEGNCEVIIADGGSDDSTLHIAHKFKKLLPDLKIHSCKRGISIQRNYGAREAMYNNIIFLDADMILPKNSLQQMAMRCETLDEFIAIPYFMPYDGKVIDKFFAFFGNIYIKLNRKFHPIACGMCIMTTKKTHKKLKGFDETLQYAEDIDYSFRAHRLDIPYYIFNEILVKSSTRRLQKITRTKLALQWLTWHIGVWRNGAKSIQGKASYAYGNFKNNRPIISSKDTISDKITK